MKRYVALFILAAMVLSQVFCVLAAEPIVFNGPDTYNQTEGEGFHDENGYAYTDYRVVDRGNASIIHHVGDWSAYDISSLAGGTYSLKMTTGNNATVKYQIKADSKIVMAEGSVAPTGGYTTFKESTVGRFYIPDGAEKLYMANIGGASLYLQSFSLEFLSEENLLLKSYEKISAKNIIEVTEGVGYHDEVASGGFRGFEQDGNCVVVRNNEWFVYDVSLFKAGTYRLTFAAACKTAPKYQIDIDGVTMIEPTSIAVSGDYGVVLENKLGYVTFDGNQQLMKLLSYASNSFLEYIILKRLEPIECESVSGNLSASGVLPRGTDRLTLSFNNALDPESVTGEHFCLKASDGGEVKVVVSAGDKANKVVLDLCESLKYNEDYTVTVKNITDEDGQTADEITAPFKTADTDNTAGVRLLKDVSHEKDGLKITVNGVITSSNGVAMANQPVWLYIKAPSDSDFVKAAEVFSADDENIGSFSITYNISEGDDPGKYTYCVGNEYIAEKDRYKDEFYYYNNELDKEITSAFYNKTAEEVESALATYGGYLGVDMTELKNDPSYSYILSGMAGRKAENTEEVSKLLQTVRALEKINAASGAENIAAVLENSDERALFEIDETAWQELESGEMSEIYDKLLKSARFNNETELTAEINSEAYLALSKRLSIASPELLVSADDIKAGETATVEIGLKEETPNVKGAELYFSYPSEAEEFFEADSEVDFKTELKKLNIEAEREDGKIKLTLNFDEATDACDELLSLNFSAPKNISGSYTASISGKIFYTGAELNEKLVISLPTDTKTVTVAVSAKSDGGGSYSGGSSAGGGASYKKTDVSLPKNNESTEKTEEFSDLAGFDWAIEAIYALKEQGIISGRSESEFAPFDEITRAEICKLIVLAKGLTVGEETVSFTDVKEDSWYCKYVAKAAKEGLVMGDGELFYPEKSLSREDLAVIIYRALTAEGANLSEEKLFADDDGISDYAKQAVRALYAAGLVNGMDEDNFCPDAYVTRAMAAKMIYGMMQRLAK